jgi:hypothetical protein
MSWREWAAAQYNHVLSIMKDTMDKTLFVIDRWKVPIVDLNKIFSLVRGNCLADVQSDHAENRCVWRVQKFVDVKLVS